MFDWLEKNLDRLVLFFFLALGFTILVGMGMAMYNLQAYYGKDNICREGRW